ncbi:hypothetical protein SPLC1_S531120 [Arthrospira platensis C1]|nr:hypothetical protein SPLC1_S531120 [Arthrospira platensis C1]
MTPPLPLPPPGSLPLGKGGGSLIIHCLLSIFYD